jgi:hypothetical protein
MTIDEMKRDVKCNVKCSVKNPPKLGGQQCGIMSNQIVLKSEDLDIEITIGHFRSQLKNKELGSTLMDLAIDELVK